MPDNRFTKGHGMQYPYTSRVSYRILSWGGVSRMIVACESMLTHALVCVPTRGVWGHARPGKMLNLDPLRLLLTQYCCLIPVTKQ